MSNQLSILKTSIRQFDSLYSLNDLHVASGGETKHKPAFFLRNDQTKELITEMKQERNCEPFKVLRGTNGGTYACEELVIAYAMWISPKFHLIVLRAFLDMHRKEPKQLELPAPPTPKTYTFEFTEFEIENLVWLWFGHKQMNVLLGELEKPLEAIASRYHATVYSHHVEYRRQYKDALSIMRRLAEPFKASNRINWERVIHRLEA